MPLRAPTRESRPRQGLRRILEEVWDSPSPHRLAILDAYRAATRVPVHSERQSDRSCDLCPPTIGVIVVCAFFVATVLPRRLWPAFVSGCAPKNDQQEALFELPETHCCPSLHVPINYLLGRFRTVSFAPPSSAAGQLSTQAFPPRSGLRKNHLRSVARWLFPPPPSVLDTCVKMRRHRFPRFLMRVIRYCS